MQATVNRPRQVYLSDEHAPHDARLHVRAMLGEGTDTETVASELVSNAVEHANGEYVEFWLATTRETIIVHVADASTAPPQLKEPDWFAESGRGLNIVAALADNYGWYAEGTGKVVWAEMTA